MIPVNNKLQDYDKPLNQFKKMYLDMYKVQLVNEEAAEYANRLIQLVKAVYGNDLPTPHVDNKAKKENT